MSIDKKKSKRTNNKMIILMAVIVAAVVLIGGGIVFARMNKKKSDKENEATVSLNETKLTNKDQNTYVSSAQTTVEILLEDCAVPVGTVFQVTAIVTPENTEQAIVWNSDHTDVFEVDKDGVVTVKGTGSAVLTATVGNVSDAVIIEGIASISDVSKNNLPLYTGGSRGTGSGSTGSAANSGNGNGNGNGGNASSTISNDDTSAQDDSSDDASDGSDTSEDSDSSDDGDNGGGSDDSGNASGGSGSSASSGQSGSQSSHKTNGITSNQIGSYLPGMGFSQDVSNVYVYHEGDNYCGEIITQPNVTIVYIKNRTAGFDSKIVSVLSTLSPGNSQQIWNNYLSAATDRTFMVDDRRVRIVVGTNNDHSQIVIYN